jgi:cytidine deaminase
MSLVQARPLNVALSRTAKLPAKPSGLLNACSLKFAGQDEVQIAATAFPTVIENPPAFDPQNEQSVRAYQRLLEMAQRLARPSVSRFPVGAVAIGESGKAYLGANIEIRQGLPSDTIHAEAFAVLNAKKHGETGLKMIVQTLRPCGSCRQVLLEAGNPEMPVHVIDMKTAAVKTMTVNAYLPDAYAYASPEKNIFKRPRLQIDAAEAEKLPNPFKKALHSAFQSYVPKPERKSWAGISAIAGDNVSYDGCVTTIPAPNNTITPVQDLLIALAADHQSPASLKSVTLVEPRDGDYSYRENTERILRQVAPQAKFAYSTLG